MTQSEHSAVLRMMHSISSTGSANFLEPDSVDAVATVERVLCWSSLIGESSTIHFDKPNLLRASIQKPRIVLIGSFLHLALLLQPVGFV